MKKIFFLTLISLIGWVTASAQDENETKVIQFSGIVVTGDSAFGVPHVHIYVPKSRRGTETNEVGYFTMPALAGDSVVIAHIGFKRQHIILPDGKDRQSYTYIIELHSDTTQLSEITIIPYPTFQLFKEAFVKADIPKDENEENWQKNLNEKKLEQMMMAMGPSAAENYRYYTLQEIRNIETGNIVQNAYVNNPLTNVFAWAKLVQELKKKAKENKKQREEDARNSEF